MYKQRNKKIKADTAIKTVTMTESFNLSDRELVKGIRYLVDASVADFLVSSKLAF